LDLSKADILALLDELILRLEASDISGWISIFGGSAIEYYHEERLSTVDIDSYLYPPNPILDVAKTITNENPGLQDNWINNHVVSVMPTVDDENPTVYYQSDSLKVTFASKEYLLAMKAMTLRRLNQDKVDAAILMNSLGLNDVSDISNIVAKYYPGEDVPVEQQAFWESIVKEVAR
jgi:hypothetical protein